MKENQKDFDDTFKVIGGSHRTVLKTNPESCPNRYQDIKEICEKVQDERKENGLEELNFND